MKKFLILMWMGIVLVSSCVKMEVEETDFVSMQQQENVVVLSTNLSTTEVVLDTKITETYEKTDTISNKVSKINYEFSYGRVHWIEDGEVVKEVRNFKVLAKKCDVTIYLPVEKRNGGTDKIKTGFSFVTEVPVLNNVENSYITVDVDAEYVKFVQDPEFREPYSTLTYRFYVTVLQNGQSVGKFSFERDFSWENTPITFDPTVGGWDDVTVDVGL